MKIKKKMALLLSGVFLSVSAYAVGDEIYCWSMTCVVCGNGTGCSDQFPAPDAICDAEGVICPTEDSAMQ